MLKTHYHARCLITFILRLPPARARAFCLLPKRPSIGVPCDVLDQTRVCATALLGEFGEPIMSSTLITARRKTSQWPIRKTFARWRSEHGVGFDYWRCVSAGMERPPPVVNFTSGAEVTRVGKGDPSPFKLNLFQIRPSVQPTRNPGLVLQRPTWHGFGVAAQRVVSARATRSCRRLKLRFSLHQCVQ